jgi:hypothetical protein
MLKNKTVQFLILILAIGVLGYFVYKYFQSEDAGGQLNSTSQIQKESEFLLTIFLKHDQGKTLDEIQKKLNETGFYKNFPPAGTEVESWKVVMGIGQVVTLRVPPSKLREVNVALEKMAWGSFKTEFYPSYDFLPIYKSYRDTTSKDTAQIIIE